MPLRARCAHDANDDKKRQSRVEWHNCHKTIRKSRLARVIGVVNGIVVEARAHITYRARCIPCPIPSS